MADTSPLSKGEAIKDKESHHIVEHLQEIMVDEIDNAAKLPWLMLADFGSIPAGIARKIALEHLDHLDDFETFRKVCSSWRSDVRDINHPNFCPCSPSKYVQLPWLMLADPPTSSYRRFYNLSKGMFRKIDLPRYDDDPEDHRRYFSSKGWLIGVSRNHGLMSFFDPFFGQTIKPPSIPLLEFVNGDDWDDESYLLQFHKFVFSTSPRSCRSLISDKSDKDDDFQVAMIYDLHRTIAFWSPGQQRWIQPAVSDLVIEQVEDVCFFRGQFYSIDHYSRVMSFGETHTPQVVVNLKDEGLVSWIPMKYYMVVLDESTLLVIHRRALLREDQEDQSQDHPYGTVSFKLVKVNVDTGKARRVKHIGNRALFVGHSSTFILEASCDGPCRPNCIYFTDDNFEWYFPDNLPDHGGSIDMGIYSLDEHKVVDRFYQGPSQFSYETPPFWVELPSHY